MTHTTRAGDEQILTILNCWEDGWSHGDIARVLPITRAASAGVVHRINDADPEALLRKPGAYRKEDAA